MEMAIIDHLQYYQEHGIDRALEYIASKKKHK